MPPKRAQLLQGIRDAYPEESAAHQIEHWATEVIPKLDGYVQSAGKLRVSFAGSAASATATPAEIVKTLAEYRDICQDVYSGAEVIRTVIATRIPEYKEEDNLGVAVQMSVLKLLDGVESRVLGGGGDDKGAQAPSNMFALKAYLSARAAVEDKLLGKPADGADEEKKGATSGGSKAPSALLELQQTDVDALCKVELAATQLASQLRIFVNAYILNWKKLIQPRVSNDRMVS